jgi:fucose 4-O-acetylase-like acetyltransferase
MNNIKKISITIFLLLVLSIPAISYSETSSNAPGTSAENPLVPCGGVNKDGRPQPECNIGHVNQIIQSGMNLVFIFAGFIVAAMFMYAGFLMITAAGNMSQIQKAKEIFRRVVIGFIIMFLAYLVVKNLLEKLDLNADPKIRSLFMNLFK